MAQMSTGATKKKHSALKIILTVVFALIVIAIAFFVYAAAKPAVPPNYTSTIATGGEIEAKYLAMGPYEVKYFEQAAMQNYKKYEIYYPAKLESGNEHWPVIVVNNGTGVKGSKSKAMFKHLASWGFIVIGNEEEYSWNGFAADMSLAYLLRANKEAGHPFFDKLDTENIGVVGHSQGGTGTVNTVTNTPHMNLYKTMVAESPTHMELSAGLEWPYDTALIHIPCFFLAGTGQTDAELIIPLDKLQEMYARISDADIKAMARRMNTDHGFMLYSADGYVTAWFMWQLKGDEQAAKAFTGTSPELLSNPLYQDQQIDIR